MVIEEDGLFRCEACGFHYRERQQAEDCEAFCREHNACSSEITAQAVEKGGLLTGDDCKECG